MDPTSEGTADSSDGGPVLVPPPRTQVTSVVGYDCDEVRPLSSVYAQPQHRRCDGWWPEATEDTDGWRCACPCHERGAGWPGYERVVESSGPPQH